MLDECLHYLERWTADGFTYEVIVVDDGSDMSLGMADMVQQKYPQVRLLRLAENQGKGMAVKVYNVNN
jgi:glycosyltransferase involved in cell wall biosynthesis